MASDRDDLEPAVETVSDDSLDSDDNTGEHEGETAAEPITEERTSDDELAEGDKIPEASGITLLEGETLLHNVRPSWANWTGQLIVISLITVFTLGVGAVLFILPWLSRRNARYIVTTGRVMKKSGILGTSTNEYRIEDIRQLQTGASWSEKLVGTGNIQFSTGAGGTTITFEGVPNYQGIANSIRSQQQ